RQPPVIDKDAGDDHGRDQEEAQGEGLEESKSSPRVPSYGQEEDVVDDLARAVGDAKPLLDHDLRHPVNDDDRGGDRRQQKVAAKPVQWAATRTTLTWRSCPSICNVWVEAPSGAWPRATATASVSVLMYSRHRSSASARIPSPW